MWFANDFHSWLRQDWKSLANHLTCDQKIIFHCNSCINLYILLYPAISNTQTSFILYDVFKIMSFKLLETGALFLSSLTSTTFLPSCYISPIFLRLWFWLACTWVIICQCIRCTLTQHKNIPNTTVEYTYHIWEQKLYGQAVSWVDVNITPFLCSLLYFSQCAASSYVACNVLYIFLHKSDTSLSVMLFVVSRTITKLMYHI